MRRTQLAYAPGSHANSKGYPFFVDSQMNKVTPTWFVEYDREEAEKKLRKRYPEQNVFLMRPSKTPGQFAISVQTFFANRWPSTAKINHYSVLYDRTNGFHIDIEKPHGWTKTLSEIMELFVELTRPIDYEMYGLRSASSPTSPQIVSFSAPSLVSLPSPPVAAKNDDDDLVNQLSSVVLPPQQRDQAKAPKTMPRIIADVNLPSRTLPGVCQNGQTIKQQQHHIYTDRVHAAGAKSTTFSDEYVPPDNGYLITNFVDEALESQMPAGVVPVGNGGHARGHPFYLELSYDTATSNRRPVVADDGYLITNYEDTDTCNRGPAVADDGYLVTNHDDNVIPSPQRAPPPPPVNRKSAAATNTKIPSSSGYLVLITDEDHVPPMAPPPLPSPGQSASANASKRQK